MRLPRFSCAKMAKPGRPMSADIPAVLADYARRHNLSMREMALRINRSENWINGMFRGDQAVLQPYGFLADFANLPIDSLVAKIRKREMAAFIHFLKLDLASRTGCEPTTAGLARAAGVSDGFLRKLAKDTGELKGLNSYVELAEAYGFTVDQLRKHSPTQAKAAS